jgi:hypothetical protein
MKAIAETVRRTASPALTSGAPQRILRDMAIIIENIERQR